ncbi:MAG TPA: U32 family peptidase [Burkholderiales bacterium]|nr:U32 family peptidase [Burkholderiales bacterium]
MKLALGPLSYHWPRQRVVDFYAGLAGSPLDAVYLGEVVCLRRTEVSYEDWLAIAADLRAAGKEVVLSTQALIESEGDLKRLRRVCGNGDYRIEVNDWNAVPLAAGSQGWVAGPHLNVYNPETLQMLHELGARRWVPPVECARGTVAGALAARPQGLEAELFAHGRLPLAFSARCFSARRFNLQKEACEQRCGEFPEGIPLQTRDGKPFLVMNGIQTQSASVYSLARDLDSVRAAGVDAIRINPQAEGTAQVADLLHELCRGALAAEEAHQALAAASPAPLANGFWHGRAGLESLA